MTVYLYRCPADHDNLRPGVIGQTPPAEVTCDRPGCGLKARRVWAIPQVTVRGGTGAGSKPRAKAR